MLNAAKKVFFGVIMTSVFGSCSHDSANSKKLEKPTRLEEQFRSYIPAKTAVLPCQFWPRSARLAVPTQDNMPAQDAKRLCAAFSKFVVSGFKNQPYMNGYSSQAVLNALTRADRKQLLESMFQSWQSMDEKCCQLPADYYKRLRSSNEAWLLWLNQISKHLVDSDAILLPLVVDASQKRSNIRGLNVASREIAVTMLLIELNEGQLVWSSYRRSKAAHKKLAAKTALEFPSWAEVEKKLFSDLLFKDFPGKVED